MQWGGDLLQWVPFVAAGMSGDGEPGDNARKVAVRIAELAIVVGFMWLQIDKLSQELDGMRKDVHRLELMIVSQYPRHQE